MLKKLLSFIVVLIMIGGVALGMTACDSDEDNINPPDSKPNRPAADNIYSDNGYVDYAKDVFYDTEQFPELATHGLFWTKWNETTKEMDLLHADTEEAAALVDPSKPTLIMVHGMLGDSYGSYRQEKFYLNGDVANSDPSIAAGFGLETSDVSLGRIWQLQGWNVAYFHYNSFTSEGPNFAAVEAKIWANDGPQQMCYRNNKKELVNASEYTVSEHFVAEYIRAMNLLPSTMGDEEIRVAVHSMGGVVGTTGVFLLTELADAGQLPQKQVPERLTLLDPFVGVKLEIDGEVLFGSATDLTIRWSGKPLYQNSTGASMVQCMKAINHRGIVIDFYSFDLGFVTKFIAPEFQEELKNYVVYSIVRPDWSGYTSKYQMLFQGHNGVRDWYFCSIAADPVRLSGEGEGTFAASASTPTEYIRENLIGVAFKIDDGALTVPADDDLFIREN